jgi:hypothetical protein
VDDGILVALNPRAGASALHPANFTQGPRLTRKMEFLNYFASATLVSAS